MLYTTFFQSWSFRTIIGLTQFLLVLASLLDAIWVARLNLSLGLPDELFAFGEEAFVDVFDQLQSQAWFIFGPRTLDRIPAGEERHL